MRYRKVVSRRIEGSEDGVNLACSVNAVIAVNVNEDGGSSHTSSKQRVKVIQRNGRTEVWETSIETKGGVDERSAEESSGDRGSKQ